MLDPSRRSFGYLALVVLGCAAAAFAISMYTGYRARATADKVEQQAHEIVQQTVRARYDDCLSGDDIRTALYEQALASARTTPLLLRLVPSIDTPAVRRLVAENRRQQLKAFRPRGTDGCRTFALRAVPPNERSQYTVPHYR